MELDEFKQKWNTLESQLKDVREKLKPLQDGEFELDRKLRDLHSFGWFKGYEYQYGEWVLKEDVRKNPLLEIPYEELRLLIPSYRKEIGSFLFRGADESILEGLNSIVVEHLKKHRLAKENGDDKEVRILMEEFMQVVPTIQ